MPYKSEKIKIEGTQFDRRVKLTGEQRGEIKYLRDFLGVSYNAIAKQFNVSKKLIIMICNPDIYEKNREQFKERRKDGRYCKGGQEWSETMKDHRRYKQDLYLHKKIGLNTSKND